MYHNYNTFWLQNGMNNKFMIMIGRDFMGSQNGYYVAHL